MAFYMSRKNLDFVLLLMHDGKEIASAEMSNLISEPWNTILKYIEDGIILFTLFAFRYLIIFLADN